MIDATRFRELWEAYCTHSANLKSAEEAGAQLDIIDYIAEEEARVLLASFLLSHAAELLALVEASTGKPTLIDGGERTTVRIGDFKLCEGRAPGKVWIETEGGEGGDFPIADIEALIREYYDANF